MSLVVLEFIVYPLFEMGLLDLDRLLAGSRERAKVDFGKESLREFDLSLSGLVAEGSVAQSTGAVEFSEREREFGLAGGFGVGGLDEGLNGAEEWVVLHPNNANMFIETSSQ